MKKIFLLSMIVLALTFFLESDIYIKAAIEFTTDQNDNERFEKYEKKENKPEMIIEMWANDNYMAYSFMDMNTIIDVNKKKAYIIDHKNKTYMDNDFSFEEQDKQLTDEKTWKMIESMEKLKDKIKVHPIKEKRKIGQWLCEGYIIEYNIMKESKSTTEVWVTKDIPFESDMLDKLQERLFSDKVIQLKYLLKNRIDLPDIEGFEIEEKTTMNMGGEVSITSTKRILEISEKTPPEGIYEIPKDYKKENIINKLKRQTRRPQKKQ